MKRKKTHGTADTIVRTSATYVDGRTGSIDEGTETFLRIGRTCKIGLTRIVGDVSHIVLEKSVSTQCGSTVARSCFFVSSAVEYELYGEINVISRDSGAR